MYCQNCGHKNEDQAGFCANCGNPQGTVINKVAPTQATPASSIATAEYAGFWRRFVAGIIDLLLVSAGIGVLTFIFVFAFPLGFFIWWLYFALMESSSHQGTIGKLAMGIIVTDMDGRRITFWKATGRYFSKFILQIILFLPYIISCIAIAFTKKKQAFHDMIPGCLVFKKQ